MLAHIKKTVDTYKKIDGHKMERLRPPNGFIQQQNIHPYAHLKICEDLWQCILINRILTIKYIKSFLLIKNTIKLQFSRIFVNRTPGQHKYKANQRLVMDFFSGRSTSCSLPIMQNVSQTKQAN